MGSGSTQRRELDRCGLDDQVLALEWAATKVERNRYDASGFRGIAFMLILMDTNKDGIVDVEDYKTALKNNPGLFEWFDLLNQQGQNDGKRAK